VSEFDLRSTTTRILECAKCDGIVAGEATGVRVELRCGYCGFADVRELGGTRPAADAESAYRGRDRAGERRPLRVALDVVPAGVPKRAVAADYRREWVLARKKVASASEDERMDAEYILLFLGAGLSGLHWNRHEHLPARAILETLLESVTVPAYRALALARLSRLAVACGSIELADKWLEACPRGFRIPEVTSEIRASEALLASAHGDAKGVLRATGEQDTVDEFVGVTRPLALALRVHAHEKLGERDIAIKVWNQAARRARGVGTIAAVYDLAPETRRRATHRGVLAILALVCLLGGLVSMFRDHDPADGWGGLPIVLLAIGALGALLVKRL